MRIRHVSIRNYRQYQRLDLDLKDPRSDVTIIVGRNGAGKTNLLNAVIWGLYEREDYYGREMESAPLVSEQSLEEAQEGAALTVSVALQIEFASGDEAEIKRTQQFIKRGKETSQGPKSLTVHVFENAGKGHEKVANPEHWIDKHVPQRLEPYFLFDGERLDDFFKKAEAKKVEDAVLQIAQIDLLARLVDHLEKTTNGLYSRAGKQGDGSELRALAAHNEELQKNLEESEATVKTHQERVSACDDAVRMLEGKIGNVKEIMADLRRRKQLEGDLAEIRGEVDSCWDDLRAWAVATAPPVLAHEALDALRSTIDTARSEHRLPPPVDPDFLAGLLRSNECVCGTSLDPASSDGASHREAIAKLVAEYERVSGLGNRLLELDGGLREALARVLHASPAVDSIMKRKGDWEGRQEATAQELEVLNNRLLGHEDTHVQQTEAQLSLAKQELEEARRQLAREEWRVEEYRREIAETERELERRVSKADKAKDILQQAQFAKACLAKAKELYEGLTNEVRSNVATSLEKHFKNMMWKQESIEEVGIDENYKVSVRNNLGYQSLGSLSAGERECLALAFSLALSEVSGYELPMVIDTPLGRLDPEVRRFVASVLAENTKGGKGEPNHQLLMLMTDAEYNDDVAKELAVRNPRVLRIEFDQADSTVQLVEVA